jgi:hypothetical protein
MKKLHVQIFGVLVLLVLCAGCSVSVDSDIVSGEVAINTSALPDTGDLRNATEEVLEQVEGSPLHRLLS